MAAMSIRERGQSPSRRPDPSAACTQSSRSCRHRAGSLPWRSWCSPSAGTSARQPPGDRRPEPSRATSIAIGCALTTIESMPAPAEVIELIGSAAGEVAIAAPGDGPGFWAGAPSATWIDGTFWLAYRLRHPVDQGRGVANVIARSEDGVRFTTVCTVTSDQFGAASLERPALIRLEDGGWRLYVSCSTWRSNNWGV